MFIFQKVPNDQGAPEHMDSAETTRNSSQDEEDPGNLSSPFYNYPKR